MSPVIEALKNGGPARARRLVTTLTRSLDISSGAARQRLSRARVPVQRLLGLLPKREAFFYLESQHNTQIYWDHLLRDLRDAGTVYACAIDGLRARGGIVPVDEFAVVSGAPVALKKQVQVSRVVNELVSLGVMREEELQGLGRCYIAESSAVMTPLNTPRVYRSRFPGQVDGLNIRPPSG